MSSQDQLDDFILNTLQGYDLGQYTFRVDVVPNVLDQWRQNFHYALGPTNPAFVHASLSQQDILVWGYTLQYNQNGILWRVDPAGRPHPDDYHKFLEQNRIIQKATERTIAEMQSNSSSGVNAKNAKQTAAPEVQSMLDRYRESERVSAPSPADIRQSQDTNTHTVREGDVLWQIAEKYGVDVQDIVEANSPKITNRHQIEKGWVLVIPPRGAKNNMSVTASEQGSLNTVAGRNPNVDPDVSFGQKVIEAGKKQLGLPYVLGGDGKSATDCGQFTLDTYQKVGIDLGSRLADFQYDYCRSNGYVFNDISQAQPGDLVFFQNTYGNYPLGTVTHVGIYKGDGLMLHAGKTYGVCYDYVMGNYWKPFFKAFGRVRK